MFLDDDLPKKKNEPEPLNLENLSIEELQEYIVWLESEIERTRQDITRKQSAGSAAEQFFKS